MLEHHFDNHVTAIAKYIHQKQKGVPSFYHIMEFLHSMNECFLQVYSDARVDSLEKQKLFTLIQTQVIETQLRVPVFLEVPLRMIQSRKILVRKAFNHKHLKHLQEQVQRELAQIQQKETLNIIYQFMVSPHSRVTYSKKSNPEEVSQPLTDVFDRQSARRD